ncbi:MAG: ATP-binding protein [Geovibrio sp.]|nr:ATP-binding protein [Geovibrio sp.]
MPDIFDPYFTTKEQGKGSGVGLYMCRTVIETNMSGKISARNEEDGAVFTITLPR